MTALAHGGDRHARPLPGRRRRASTASATAASCARGRSTTSGSSRRPATPAARSAWRWPSGTATSASRGKAPRQRDLGPGLPANGEHEGQRRRGTTDRHERLAALDGLPPMKTACPERLGPAVPSKDIAAWLELAVARSARSRADAADEVARLLAEEKVVGLLQGRMEFGPRALGGRSIIGDRALAEDAGGHEPEDQVPRVVPAVRAVGAARARGRVVRARRRQPLHAAGRRRGQAAPARDAGCRAGALGHREAERAALDGAGDHARRLLGAHPDGAPRDEPAVLRHHRRPSTAAPAAR